MVYLLGHVTVVLFLLKHGASIHTESHEGANPLYHVYVEVNADVVAPLTSLSIHVLMSPLHVACSVSVIPLIKVLLAPSADVNSKDCCGLSLRCALQRTRRFIGLTVAQKKYTRIHDTI